MLTLKNMKYYRISTACRRQEKLTRVIAVEIIANSETPLQTFCRYIANDFSASCVTHRLAWVACCLIARISTIPIIIITGSKTFCVTLILLTLTPSPFLTLCHCHHWMHHSAIVKFHLCHWYITNWLIRNWCYQTASTWWTIRWTIRLTVSELPNKPLNG